jgi:hypothetical protein
LAKLVPAISAAVATVIIKRLIMDVSPQCLRCPADNERRCAMFRDISGSIDFVF